MDIPAKDEPAPADLECPSAEECSKAYDERLERVKRKLGLHDHDFSQDVWPAGFDDPEFSRAVLGLDD